MLNGILHKVSVELNNDGVGDLFKHNLIDVKVMDSTSQSTLFVSSSQAEGMA